MDIPLASVIQRSALLNPFIGLHSPLQPGLLNLSIYPYSYFPSEPSDLSTIYFAPSSQFQHPIKRLIPIRPAIPQPHYVPHVEVSLKWDEQAPFADTRAKIELRLAISRRKELQRHKNSAPMTGGGEGGGVASTTQRNSNQLVVQRRGIKVLINNRICSAFGDTGAGQNVISDRYCQELKLEMRPNPKTFPMGNSKKIFSPGTVEVPLAFEEDPTNVITILAHVVHTFAYDLLLGNPFLRATQCLTKYTKRFVPCLFSLKSRWSFHLLKKTTERFQAKLGNGVFCLGLPDIGSVRNVMDFGWATAQNQNKDFKILTRTENRGWILFPDGTEEATIGQAYTNITLPDGQTVPIIFELLPNCHVPVVFGQDFIFEHDIYTNYPSSLMNVAGNGFGDELMPMGYRWHRSESKKLKLSSKLLETTQDNELERQMEWNLKFKHGRTAPVDEWNTEHAKRESYERRQDPNWLLDSSISLIEHKPIVEDRKYGQTRIDAQTPAQSTRHARGSFMVGGISDETASSLESRDTTLDGSSSTLLDSASSSSGKNNGRAGSWHGNAYFDGPPRE